MFPRRMHALLLGAIGLLFLGGAVSAQQQQPQGADQQQTQDAKKKKKNAKAGTAPASTTPAASPTPTPPPPPASKPKPLFGGSLNLKSSRQSKDATTLGFNGLDPNGKVEKSLLQANPTPQDTAEAQQLAAYQVNAARLDSFIKSGNLTETAPPKEAAPKGRK